MSNKVQVSSGNVGFFGLLGLLFIGLKLGHVINWSWWYVTMPLWLPLCLVFAISFVALFIYAIYQVVKK